MFQEIASKLDDWIMFFSAWSKTAMSIEYGLPTIITAVVIAIKIFVNRTVCALDVKKAVMDLPCEMITLSLGFIIIRVDNTKEILSRTFIIVFLLILTAASINYLQREDVISKIELFNTYFWWCVCCYILAIFLLFYSMNVVIG